MVDVNIADGSNARTSWAVAPNAAGAGAKYPPAMRDRS
jgi:hypothetical protein